MSEQKPRLTWIAVKRFAAVAIGSAFLQILCWAIYSYFELHIVMCGLSILVTALMYHFLQKEQETGLSRISVFFAAIILPFAAALTVTVSELIRHPNLNLLNASLDGVSPLTETVSLYAARLTFNGVCLLVFAPIDRLFRKERKQADEKPA